MKQDQLVIQKIETAFPQAIQGTDDHRGEQTLIIDGKHLENVCQFLHDDPDLQYTFISDIVADDYLNDPSADPDAPRFVVNYHLYSLSTTHRLRLRVLVADPDKGPDTIGNVWKVGTWLEMEVWDLMGIVFAGNGSLRRLFMPEDWQGHPLRKDYPLGYEEVQFSFNWKEIEDRKLHGLRVTDDTYTMRTNSDSVQEMTVEELRAKVGTRMEIEDPEEHMLLSMGPQHPSTHGVLRLLVELDGETVVNLAPDIGFLHTGIEKTMESKQYLKGLVLTDRMDYLSPMTNNLGYVLAIEKLLGVEATPRAQVIRVMLSELSRIASHLVWLGTHALDMAAMNVFIYAFREREYILDLFEMVAGQRMMVSYIRPGGLWRDLPDGFIPAVKHFIDFFPAKIADYDALLKNNPIFLNRTVGVGVISAEDATSWGLTGANLRASGVDFDVRKMWPYCGYENYDFNVPVRTEGDIYARYRCRVEEMEQSLRIIEQAVEKLPDGPVNIDDHKIVPPPRSELGGSMEAVIHHFKLWTEGFSPPVGSVYQSVESPRGEFACYLRSDGTAMPARAHFRTPSYVNLASLPVVGKGVFMADLVALIGSADIVLGEIDR